MEDFKLKYFNEEYGFDIPTLKKISLDECVKIRSKLYTIYNIENIDVILKEMYNNCHPIKKVDIKEEKFDFKDILIELDIFIPKEIYINWFKFDKIDIISFDVFNKYFFDIWYPIADDIEIFNKDLKWIISIRHDGIISLVDQIIS